MIRPVACLVDHKRAAHQRLGLGEAVRGLKSVREIVETDRKIGMVRPVALSRRYQRAAQQRFGFGQTVRGLKQLREIVEMDRHIGMIWS